MKSWRFHEGSVDEDPPTFEDVLRLAARVDHDVVTMVNGAPDWEPPKALRDGLREAAGGEPSDFQYTPVRGLRSLRETIAERRDVPEESIVVTAGATEANHLAMARALSRDAGRKIIIADPYYPYYVRRTRLLGGRPVTVPVASDGTLDPETVRQAAGSETAAIIVNTPNNPTGSVYPRSTLEALVQLAENRDALFISDETYGHVDLSGSFVSAQTVESDNRIVTTSVSKSLAATGIRIGYLIAPPDQREALVNRHELTTITANRPGQVAVQQALSATGPAYYKSVRDRLRDRRDTFTDALADLGAEFTTPDMGFYVLARLPGLPGTAETVRELIESVGVAAMPGAAFGSARANWLRFALVTPRVETAAARLRNAMGPAGTDEGTSDDEGPTV